MQERPNIVLLMTDQMRGDCLGIAGHPDVKTPYLDSLADMGTLYTNAYSACPTCVPARATLHTGMSQRHTGRVGYEDGVRWDYEHTLAGELSKAGYYTQCVGKMHVHPLRNYLGFHNVRLHDGYLHAYRAPDVPYYESQKVADDYYWWQIILYQFIIFTINPHREASIFKFDFYYFHTHSSLLWISTNYKSIITYCNSNFMNFSVICKFIYRSFSTSSLISNDFSIF